VNKFNILTKLNNQLRIKNILLVFDTVNFISGKIFWSVSFFIA